MNAQLLTSHDDLLAPRRGADAEPCLLVERDGPIALVTLNRPAARNAITPEMSCRLADAFMALGDDPDVRCIVLTGRGEKAFCSGGDLALTLPLLTGARAPETDWDRRFLDDPSVLRHSSLQFDGYGKPVVAAVNGACLAAGFELLLGTDVRVAAEGAVFGLPEVVHGLVPFAGAPTRLPRQVGHANALAIMLTGEPVDAATALRVGLVNEVVPGPAVLDRATAIARRIASNGPVAVQELKRTVEKAAGLSLGDGYDLEDATRRVVLGSEDAREGPRAFTEKRRPRFTGR